jgi:hypothetical protein
MALGEFAYDGSDTLPKFTGGFQPVKFNTSGLFAPSSKPTTFNHSRDNGQLIKGNTGCTSELRAPQQNVCAQAPFTFTPFLSPLLPAMIYPTLALFVSCVDVPFVLTNHDATRIPLGRSPAVARFARLKNGLTLRPAMVLSPSF